MKKPTVTTNPVANQYSARNERIVEVSFPSGKGGLISLTSSEDRDRIELYRFDKEVQIGAPGTFTRAQRAMITFALNFTAANLEVADLHDMGLAEIDHTEHNEDVDIDAILQPRVEHVANDMKEIATQMEQRS